MRTILVVDDEMRIRDMIRKYAEFEGFSVAEARDGMEAIQMCREHTYDFIIMDVMIPQLDGFSACSEIRKSCDTPVLMLSARGEEYDKIHGFEIGVDDYVVKPFSPKELMMRVHAILKRTETTGNIKELYEDEGLKVDMTARKVYIDEREVIMSPKEYALLFYLVRNAGIALTREQLIRDVWNYDFYGDDRTLDTHIKLLRRSLGIYSSRIVTLRGVGYRFEAAK
ncbi:MAG: response regulator transcription factor [Erysipelotrichaceae bacterium]|jgi:two-component system response regulator ResD|nr:response regulator transcription factor [Erysipelotrichaceae bacterium]